VINQRYDNSPLFSYLACRADTDEVTSLFSNSAGAFTNLIMNKALKPDYISNGRSKLGMERATTSSKCNEIDVEQPLKHKQCVVHGKLFEDFSV